MSEVLDRMIAAVGADNAPEGSFIRDNIAAVAAELDRLWSMGIDYMPQRIFPTLAEGDDLTLAAANFGVDRKAAVASSVVLTITGAAGAQIDGGIKAVCGELIFACRDAEIPAGGSVNVTAVCETTGAAGNVLAGAITEFATTYEGLESVINSASAIGGTDEESDEDLLERVRVRWQSPSTGGNQSDYIRWALSVPGVSRAKAANPSAGNVTVTIVATGPQEASQTLISAVSDAIEAVRPIGAAVTVAGGEAVTADIAASITLEEGQTTEAVQARIEANLADYFADVAFKTSSISYLKIANLLFVEGVASVTSYTLNSGTANIALDNDQFGVKGTVSINAA